VEHKQALLTGGKTRHSEPQLRTYLDGGINWNWYLQGQFNDANKTVTILYYERFHKYEQGKHPLVDFPRADVRLLEDANRDVYGVRVTFHDTIADTDYLVLNPANIFSYKDFSQMVLEGGK